MGTEEMTTSATLLGEPLPVELMNTVGIDRGRVHDALESDADVTAWLRAVADRIGTEAGVVLSGLDEDAVRPVAGRVRALRDALRRLAAETTEDPRPPATAPELTRPDAIATLNALAGACPELVWPAGGQPARAFHAAGTCVDLAIGLIAYQGIELFAGLGETGSGPAWHPTACSSSSRNARREWCSPGCGNRARVARHYQRHYATRQN